MGWSAPSAGAAKLGNIEAASRLLAEIAASDDPHAPIIQRIQAGEILPGFGSHLYPSGDPRARALLDQARIVYADDRTFQKINAAFDTGRAVAGAEPSFGLACVVVGRQIGSRRGTPCSTSAAPPAGLPTPSSSTPWASGPTLKAPIAVPCPRQPRLSHRRSVEAGRDRGDARRTELRNLSLTEGHRPCAPGNRLAKRRAAPSAEFQL